MKHAHHPSARPLITTLAFALVLWHGLALLLDPASTLAQSLTPPDQRYLLVTLDVPQPIGPGGGSPRSKILRTTSALWGSFRAATTSSAWMPSQTCVRLTAGPAPLRP